MYKVAEWTKTCTYVRTCAPYSCVTFSDKYSQLPFMHLRSHLAPVLILLSTLSPGWWFRRAVQGTTRHWSILPWAICSRPKNRYNSMSLMAPSWSCLLAKLNKVYNITCECVCFMHVHTYITYVHIFVHEYV